MNHHWHIYTQEELKPALTGDRVYALAVPDAPEADFRAFVGKTLRHHRVAGLPQADQDALVLSYRYGVLFEGVSPGAIAALPQPSPPANPSGLEVRTYNKQVISNAKDLFLARSSFPRNIDPLTFCLVQGLTHLLPAFESFPRIPIVGLERPTDNRAILIVEDQEAQLQLFRVLLESMGYSNLFLARDGTQALPILKARGDEIDLILLNWEMPRMNGLAFMRHLARSCRRTVGVLMESGYPHTEFKREFFRLGTASVLPIDYLVKPFLLDEFVLEVRVAMEYVHRRKLRGR